MHIADFDKGMLGANGIVGGGPPLVCGVGLSAKVRDTGQVGVAFVGDGGSNQGTFLESLNLASAWDLPVVFVVENNGYAEATSSKFHQAGVDVAKRADGFGMPGVVVDGHDFFAVYETAGEAIARARARVTEAGLCEAGDLDAIDREVEAQVDDAVEKAKAAADPLPGDLLTDVYVSY
jgi:pyruvate dehydrogenase E1 component alpha subunit